MARLIQASANNPLDVLLEELCLELGLTEAQHERASRAYLTVGNWLSDTSGTLAVWQPRVFPQGSIPLGTAVRPRDTDQFDADGVCLLQAGLRLSPSEAYEGIRARIADHQTYRRRIHCEPRCIRLDYEGGMHLDIIPAIPGAHGILIPTADRGGWQSTDPERYQSWFETVGRAITLGIEKRADAEPMPRFQEVSAVSPLKRVVQLAKRRRDVAISDARLKPKSILLTTLIAQQWNGAKLASDGLLGVLSRLKDCYPTGSLPPVVANPANLTENLARHWGENAAAYDEFTAFVSDFAGCMEALLRLQGVEAITEALEHLFDPTESGLVKTAVSRYTDRFQGDRSASRIRAASSAVAATYSIPVNQFYGR